MKPCFLRTVYNKLVLSSTLAMLLILGHDTLQSETIKTSGIYRDAVSYVLDKCKSHDVVLLGSKHKKPEIMSFISQLLPRLRGVDVSHIGLEIASDQQSSVERYFKENTGLEEISLHHALDFAGYRNLLSILRNISQKNKLKVIALDLPPSLYKKNTNRDEWMAKSICTIFDENPNAKVLVIVGNLHTLKRIRWEDHIPEKHGFIPSYIHKLKPELKIFSISQCFNHPPSICDFCKYFSGESKPVATDCDGLFSDWKLGVLESVAAKPMKAHELIDGVIVY